MLFQQSGSIGIVEGNSIKYDQTDIFLMDLIILNMVPDCANLESWRPLPLIQFKAEPSQLLINDSETGRQMKMLQPKVSTKGKWEDEEGITENIAL